MRRDENTSYLSVYDGLLKLLSQKPDCNAKELRALLAQGDCHCSLQAVYKELSRLETEGKVFRHLSRYRLHLGFVHETLALADRMNEAYCRTPQHSVREAVQGRNTFSFSNLLRLNDFWTNLSLSLVLEAKEKRYFSWNPISWFYLFQPKQEENFYRVLRTSGFEVYKILGDGSWVNLQASKTFDGGKIEIGFGRSPFQAWEKTYLTIIDETIIAVELSQKTANRLHMYLSEITSTRILNKTLLLEWSRTPIQATLSIRNSRSNATKYKKWFLEYF